MSVRRAAGPGLRSEVLASPATRLDHGLRCIWPRRLGGGAEWGAGRWASVAGGSRGRSAPHRGPGGGRRGRLAGAACCCHRIGSGPGHGSCRSRPCGQAVINGLSLHSPL